MTPNVTKAFDNMYVTYVFFYISKFLCKYEQRQIIFTKINFNRLNSDSNWQLEICSKAYLNFHFVLTKVGRTPWWFFEHFHSKMPILYIGTCIAFWLSSTRAFDYWQNVSLQHRSLCKHATKILSLETSLTRISSIYSSLQPLQLSHRHTLDTSANKKSKERQRSQKTNNLLLCFLDWKNKFFL